MKLLLKRRLKYTNILPPYLENNRVNFKPEIEPEYIKYNKFFWKKVFPYKKDVSYERYQMSNIGKYSIFFPHDADKTARIIRSFFPSDKNVTITDATSNMGGATIAFTNHFDKVNAVEIVKLHCDILKNNLDNYGTLNKVKIYCENYLDAADKIEQDAIFFDPPWGGPDYKEQKLLNMYLDNISIDEILKSLLDRVKIIAIRVPFNYDFKKILRLTKESYVHTFYKPNGNFNYFLIILQTN
uniref:RNA cap guanine-N2 methyltransferase n=1 Tax=Megaviridae environmental sample TaxID=1737588 RepID=A0A5J6VKP4_9VIRU|nr:MAG: RNA cap guanine-N2 methyltransferase [Megaviridae environmental sample]